MVLPESSPFDEETVDYDVVFGYSYMTKDRKASHEYAQRVISAVSPEFRSRFLIKDKINDVDTSVPRGEYVKLLSRSRFTFVAPAYEPGIFSPFRYQEALKVGCLPLVFETCPWREFVDSFDIDEGTFRSLVVNPSDVTPTMQMREETRLDLVRYLSSKVLNF
jgi:hypothetical protein